MLRSFSLSSAFRALPERPFAHDGESCGLGRKTVIYGRNGSGKTTLSEILRLAASGGDTEGSLVSAAIRMSGANSSSRLDGSSGFPWRVFVYNRHYVQDSLSGFLEGSDGSPTILKIGADNVAAAQKLSATRAHIGVLRGRSEALTATRKVLEAERDVWERQTKAEIIAALSASDPALYNSTRFQVTKAKALLSDESCVKLSEPELQSETAVATAPTMSAVALQSQPPRLANDLKRTINDQLLSAAVESQTIPRLADDRELSEWVEVGLQFHESGDACKFCGDGVLAVATLDSYRLHFSAALAALRKRLQDAISYLDRIAAEIDEWVLTLPTAEEFLFECRPSYTEAREALVALGAAVIARIGVAKERIQIRLADPLVPLPNEQLLEDEFGSLDSSALEAVLIVNAEACKAQVGRRQAAQRAVEGHFAAEGGVSYRTVIARVARLGRAEAGVARRAAALTLAASDLEQAQEDTSRMAVEINADVRDHFGHGHLRIAVSDDRKGYVVLRGTKLARRLSEGERNAIAFAYFLRTLEADGVDPAASIVVIDDPVTSMDKESLFAGFSLAEERTRDFAQVVVLTHDYEYFRLQLRQRANARKKSERKIREGNLEEKALPAVSILEMVASINPATGKRTSSLRAMPHSLTRHPSEYHYLFLHVAEAVQTSDPATLPLLGNAARRLLEGFISFRAPHGDDFQQKIDSIKLAEEIDPVLAGRVVKFLHGMSHREEPRPNSALDFPSIEHELRSALDFMHRGDAKHFAAMCNAVELDPASVLAAIAGPREAVE